MKRFINWLRNCFKLDNTQDWQEADDEMQRYGRVLLSPDKRRKDNEQ